MNVEDYIRTPEYTQIAILRKLRMLGGIRVQDVANAIKCSQSHLTQMENGRRGAEPLDIEAYCEYLEGALKLKHKGLYDAVTRLSVEYRITDADAQMHPVDFLCVYLKAICSRKGGTRK